MASEKRSYDNVEGESEGHTNPSKKTKQQESSSSSKRFWSEDEEILILNIAIEFANQKGLDPTAHGHRTHFFKFMKRSFSDDLSKRQVHKKLRRLKKNFERHFVKANAISNAHQNKVFELSLDLWGSKSKETSATADEEGQGKKEDVGTQIGSELEEDRVCDV